MNQRKVSIKKAILTRLVKSIVMSVVSSLLFYMFQQFMKNNGVDLFQSTNGENGPESQKHKNVALACIEDPGMYGLDDVGGLQTIKNDLREGVLRAMQYPHLFFSETSVIGLSPQNRILFSGPPGTGKTMLAKALAVDSGAVFLNVTLSTLEDKFFGETPKIMKAIFSVAAEKSKTQPVIIFFDEIDGIMRKRKDDDHSSVYGMKTEFLQHMDSLKGAVVVIGCTNYPEMLDPALKRRLPDVFQVPLPTPKQRLDILKRITVNDKVEKGVLKQVALNCDKCSGSDLKQRYKKACMQRSRRILPTLDMENVSCVDELAQTMPALDLSDFT